MSSSTRSKSESPSSPETGSATDAISVSDAPTATAVETAEAGDEPPPRRRSLTGAVEVELEISRQRSITWVIAGTAIGAVLITQLGTVGVWVGFLLVAIAILHAATLVQSMMYAPGTIVVTDTAVTLPRGLCRPKPLVVKPDQVTAAYFLRRSVPWNRSSPVLIVEVGTRALVFPRDWFASEADQRHVIHALLRDRAA